MLRMPLVHLVPYYKISTQAIEFSILQHQHRVFWLTIGSALSSTGVTLSQLYSWAVFISGRGIAAVNTCAVLPLAFLFSHQIGCPQS